MILASIQGQHVDNDVDVRRGGVTCSLHTVGLHAVSFKFRFNTKLQTEYNRFFRGCVPVVVVDVLEMLWGCFGDALDKLTTGPLHCTLIPSIIIGAQIDVLITVINNRNR